MTASELTKSPDRVPRRTPTKSEAAAAVADSRREGRSLDQLSGANQLSGSVAAEEILDPIAEREGELWTLLRSLRADTPTLRREPVEIVGAGPGLVAYLVAHAGLAWSGPVLVVTPEQSQASTLADSLDSLGGHVGEVRNFPPPDVGPFESLTPNRFIEMTRLATLYRLGHGISPKWTVASAAALAPLVPDAASQRSAAVEIEVGGRLERDAFLRSLVAAGYDSAPTVVDPGSFAVRGGLVDVFSPLYERPLRLDFFDDELDSLRFFDPDSQRSAEAVARAVLIPARSTILPSDGVRALEEKIGELAAIRRMPTRKLAPLIADLREGLWPSGVHALLPAFGGDLVPFERYIAEDTLVVWVDPEGAKRHFEECIAAEVTRSTAAIDRGRLVYSPDEYLDRYARGLKALHRSPTWRFTEFSRGRRRGPCDVHLAANDHQDLRERLDARRSEDRPLEPAAVAIREWLDRGLRVHIVCRTDGSVERIRRLLDGFDLPLNPDDRSLLVGSDASTLGAGQPMVLVGVGAPLTGFCFEPAGLVVLDESDLLGAKTARRRRRSSPLGEDAIIESFQSLRPGDFVVHADHGVARYEGLVHLTVMEIAGDYLHLTFKGDDKLYLPIANLHRVGRYIGSDADPPSLDRLGGQSWEKTKARVKGDLLAMAKDLVELQAKRQAATGFRFGPLDAEYRAFEASFPYDETPDQQSAIDAVMSDLSADTPADRLVCGDVGFGKTEVAIRAAFRAVLDGRQVAILAPTTVLVEQHVLTLRRRLEGWPISVDSLSRAKSSAEQKHTIEQLATGRLDIVVGTHRLLSDDVAFRNLGLIVIDEEHRFGVKQKEKLKSLRASVHILTLTATPIPRTLHMSMMGIRELSVMRTPPRDRLAVHTIVETLRDEVVVDAIERELARGGQVFFVHNRVRTIGRRAEMIRSLVPHARIAVGHGQMGEGELAKVMRSFVRGDSNVLVSTTIIESGIDIPNANTLIVERADCFGLAELYQLRGRVGRSHRRAYAYLLVPEVGQLTGDAARRIGVLQRFTELGSGFKVASQDLEIRGAGNVLGGEQSGSIDAIGFDLYFEMLQDAVQQLRGDEVVARVDAEVQAPIEAFIPEPYCPQTGLRLAFYKRMAQAETAEEVDTVLSEVVDRCGRNPPEPVRAWADLARLRLGAAERWVERVQISDAGVVMRLAAEAPVDPQRLVALLQLPRTPWRMAKDGSSLVFAGAPGADSPVQYAWRALRTLSDTLGMSAPDA